MQIATGIDCTTDKHLLDMNHYSSGSLSNFNAQLKTEKSSGHSNQDLLKDQTDFDGYRIATNWSENGS